MKRIFPEVDGTGGCLLVIIFMAAFALLAVGAEPKSAPAVVRSIDGPRYYLSEVINVVDGDTIDLRFKVWPDITLEKRIRFDDINTWEIRGENKTRGLKARQYLISLLSKGKVYLKTTGKTGNFGRTLGSIHVLTDDKMIDVSREMKNQGHQRDD